MKYFEFEFYFKFFQDIKIYRGLVGFLCEEFYLYIYKIICFSFAKQFLKVLENKYEKQKNIFEIEIFCKPWKKNAEFVFVLVKSLWMQLTMVKCKVLLRFCIWIMFFGMFLLELNNTEVKTGASQWDLWALREVVGSNPKSDMQGSHLPLIPWKTLGLNYWFYKRLKTLDPHCLTFNLPAGPWKPKKKNQKKNLIFKFGFPLFQTENVPWILIMTLWKSPLRDSCGNPGYVTVNLLANLRGSPH